MTKARALHVLAMHVLQSRPPGIVREDPEIEQAIEVAAEQMRTEGIPQ